MNRAHSVIVRACSRLAVLAGAWIIGLAVVWTAAAPRAAFGQSAVWQPQGATTGSIYYNGGNVGIGTTNPASRLTVSGTGSTTSGQTDVQITGTGNVGGGVNLISSDAGGRNWLILSTGSATGIPGSQGFFDSSVGAYRFVVSSAGNVGIGTTNPTSKLSVNGTIQAKEVIVNTGWADYVFEPAYRLKPLKEIAAYIKENHHLPEIPSEAEVQENGVSLGEMQSKLLAKIEELTLHMIKEHERNDRLECKNRELQRQVLAIREQNRERMVSLANSSPLSPNGKSPNGKSPNGKEARQ